LVIATISPKMIHGAYSRSVCIVSAGIFGGRPEGGAYDTGSTRRCVLRPKTPVP